MVTAVHQDLRRWIDHTLLKPDASEAEFLKLFDEARVENFFAVCVPPHFVSLAKRELKSSAVKVCTVIGFPFGYETTAAKVFATRDAIEKGADEIDVVMNIAAFKSGQDSVVVEDLTQVVRAAQAKVVKVIIETALLTDEEIVRACYAVEKSGAQFVKTSTGFASHGAKVEHVQLMKQTVAARLKIKASGGIRDRAMAEQMVAAGADRIGASKSVEIVRGR